MKLEPDDKVLVRTILQVLTQTCGLISFNLFAKICHCLVLTKQYIKQFRDQENKDNDDKTRNELFSGQRPTDR